VVIPSISKYHYVKQLLLLFSLTKLKFDAESMKTKEHLNHHEEKAFGLCQSQTKILIAGQFRDRGNLKPSHKTSG